MNFAPNVIALALASMVALGVGCGDSDTPHGDAIATVDGVVTDSISGLRLPGVSVGAGTDSTGALTDSLGAYVLHLGWTGRPGVLRFRHSGYKESAINVEAAGERLSASHWRLDVSLAQTAVAATYGSRQ